jgi:hypothetical protein
MCFEIQRIKEPSMHHLPFRLSVLMILALFIITGCSASPPVVSVEKIPEADLPPAEAVQQLGGEIESARRDQIDVLSPTLFQRAAGAYQDAEKALEAGDETAAVSEYVHTSRLYLYDAAENAKIAPHCYRRSHSKPHERPGRRCRNNKTIPGS